MLVIDSGTIHVSNNSGQGNFTKFRRCTACNTRVGDIIRKLLNQGFDLEKIVCIAEVAKHLRSSSP